MTRAYYTNIPDVHVALIVHKVVRVRADCPRSVVRFPPPPSRGLPWQDLEVSNQVLVPDLIAHLAASRYWPRHIGSLDPTTGSLETRGY
jgi:hypothetical protein